MFKKSTRFKERAVDPSEYRQFSKFLPLLMPALYGAAAAYCHIVRPPFAREPEQMQHTDAAESHRGRWLDHVLGGVKEQALAKRAWQLADDYQAETARQRSPEPIFTTMTFRAPLDDVARAALFGHRVDESTFAAGDVQVSCAVRANCYTPVYPATARNGYDATLYLRTESYQDDYEVAHPALCEWMSAFVTARHEAFEALCFLLMLGKNGQVSTRTMMQTFPWLKMVAHNLRPDLSSEIWHEALLPWRGHNFDLVDAMTDSEPPKTNNTTPPWTRFAVARWLVEFGEQRVSPTLAKLVLAKTHYPTNAPNSPHETVKLSLPYSPGMPPNLHSPEWFWMYAGAAAGDPSAGSISAKTELANQAMIGIAAAKIR